MDDLTPRDCHHDRREVERETRASRELDGCLARWRALPIPILDEILVCALEPDSGQDEYEWEFRWACAIARDVDEQACGAIFELLARVGRRGT